MERRQGWGHILTCAWGVWSTSSNGRRSPETTRQKATPKVSMPMSKRSPSLSSCVILLFFSFELTTNDPGGGQDLALQHASWVPTPTRFTSSKVSSKALKQKLRQQIINGT